MGQDQDIYLGELDGSVTDQLKDLQHALSAVMPTHLTDNIFGFLWGKLVYGSMAFAVSTVDAPVPEILADPRGLAAARTASSETALVGSALGYGLQPIGRFEPSAFLPGPDMVERENAALETFRCDMAGSIKQHMGIWRDLNIKKRQTEVDVQCGVVVERARKLGIAVPDNAAIVRIIHEIEAGEREMSWSNLDGLADAIPE